MAAATLWEPLGFWRRAAVARAYPLGWRYRAMGLVLAVTAALVVSPLAAARCRAAWCGRWRSAWARRAGVGRRPDAGLRRPGRAGRTRRRSCPPGCHGSRCWPRAAWPWCWRSRRSGRRGWRPAGRPGACCGASPARRWIRGGFATLATGALWDLLRGGAKLGRAGAARSQSALRRAADRRASASQGIATCCWRCTTSTRGAISCSAWSAAKPAGGSSPAPAGPSAAARRGVRSRRPTPAASWWTSCRRRRRCRPPRTRTRSGFPPMATGAARCTAPAIGRRRSRD